MSVKVGINGLGRIGKGIISAWINRKFEGMEIVMINDITDPASYAHLLKYDSVHGRIGADIKTDCLPSRAVASDVPREAAGNTLSIGGSHKIRLVAQPNPNEIPWDEAGVDVVLECSGRFTDRAKADLHRQKGVKKVIISAPGKDPDLTVVMGVNDTHYDPKKHHIISNASCTTNCLAPTAKVLHENFGIERGFMTTIHSYTNDQQLLDRYHKDLRRARAGALSMIPTSTGAAKSIGVVMPELAGRMDGMSIRVPTPNVSVVDLVCSITKKATRDDINAAYRKAAEGPLKGILACSNEPLVSIDFNGTTQSATIDTLVTASIEDRLVKVLAWYDNETGFSNRMLDLTALVAKGL